VQLESNEGWFWAANSKSHTPGPPRFSWMNSTPAASKARRFTGKSRVVDYRRGTAAAVKTQTLRSQKFPVSRSNSLFLSGEFAVLKIGKLPLNRRRNLDGKWDYIRPIECFPVNFPVSGVEWISRIRSCDLRRARVIIWQSEPKIKFCSEIPAPAALLPGDDQFRDAPCSPLLASCMNGHR
jgi:hypothetical protein